MSMDVKSGGSISGQSVKGMSWIAGMCVIAGCMIGAGVFVTGGSIFKEVPNAFACIALWIVGGITAICGGLTWAEWSLMIPKSGFDIPYLEHAYPNARRFFSFQFIWSRSIFAHPTFLGLLSSLCTYFIIYICASKEFSTAVKFYIVDGLKEGQVVPANVMEHNGPTMYIIFIAVGFSLMSVAFALVAFSDKIIMKSTTALTIFKMLIIAILIGCGFATLSSSYRPEFNHNAWKEALQPDLIPKKIVDGKSENQKREVTPSGVAGGLLTVFFSYDGFALLSTVVADLKDPRRDILRAILAGVIVVSTLYIGINSFYFFAFSGDEIAEAGYNLAGRYVTKILMGDAPAVGEDNSSYNYYSHIIDKVMTFLVFLSAFGASLGISFAAARTTYVSGTMGNYLPFSSLLGEKHHKFGTPFNAVLLQFVLGAVIFLLGLHPKIGGALFKGSMYCCYIFYTLTAASLIYVRFRDKHIERPFRVFLGCPLLVTLVGLFMLIFPWIQTDPAELVAPIFGVFSFLLGMVVYYFHIYRKYEKTM